jgi:phospholipase/lecithinase/hemolysin
MFLKKPTVRLFLALALVFALVPLAVAMANVRVLRTPTRTPCCDPLGPILGASEIVLSSRPSSPVNTTPSAKKTPLSLAQAGTPAGIGVLGDSYSDEYQFYPPDRSTARNWVEILAATRGLDFGPFSVASRGEPRNQGFAHNWARSDATTDDMIAGGQHTGLAAQVARGEVRLALVFIGGNDFINALKSADPAGRLQDVLPRAVANYRLAIQTLLDAGPAVGLVLATLPDIRNLPEFAGPIREGRLPRAIADRYTVAIGQFNNQIRSLALANPRVALVDLDLATGAANLMSRESTLIGGRRLDRLHAANDSRHFFLADVRHAGTLGQGLMAQMFLEVVNARFAAGIAPLKWSEIFDLADEGSQSGR